MPTLATMIRDTTDLLDPQTPLADSPARAGYAATPAAYDVGLLMLRLTVGVIMFIHGSQKLFGIFDGTGISGTAKEFAAVGYPISHVMAVVAGLCETFGGLGLVFGLLTPLAAAAVVGDMINATVVVSKGGFFAPKGFEYELFLTLVAACIALTGPGRYAVDRYVPVVRAHRLVYGVVSVILAAATASVFLLFRH
jgi:putative oxidoreductase